MRSQHGTESIRAAVEALEARLFLSTSVVFDGVTLRIIGDDLPQTVRIVEQSLNGSDAPTHVSVDADGNGSFTDPGDLIMGYRNVQAFDIRLAGGNDTVTFELQRTYSGVVERFNIDLADGNDSFRYRYNSTESPGISSSTFTMNVTGGTGDDDVRVSFPRIVQSTVNVAFDLGTGNDTGQFFIGYPVTGSFTATAQLGAGDDVFDVFFDGEDNFRLPGGTMQIDVYGGGGQDVLTSECVSGWRTAWIDGHLHLGLFGQADGDYISTYLPAMVPATAESWTYRRTAPTFPTRVRPSRCMPTAEPTPSTAATSSRSTALRSQGSRSTSTQTTAARWTLVSRPPRRIVLGTTTSRFPEAVSTLSESSFRPAGTSIRPPRPVIRSAATIRARGATSFSIRQESLAMSMWCTPRT